ncbi:KIN17-like protein [Schistocerca americana]|uniref:KIN17-like protein n=1 Tax=Schistocerca americana TaxID=7009 RepID=UPI001F4F2A08|nr:KIN17-like protein [Schistocerca americana]
MNDNLETDVTSDIKTEELPKPTETPAFNRLVINDNIYSGQGAEVSNAQAMSIQDMLTALFEKFTIKELEREKQHELTEQERERQRQQEKEKRRQEKLIEKQQQELSDQEKEKKFMENINNIFLERDKGIVRRINQVLVDRDNTITTHFKQEIDAVGKEKQDLVQRDFQPAADPNHDAADGSRRPTDSAEGGPAAATTCLRSSGSTRGRSYDVSSKLL